MSRFVSAVLCVAVAGVAAAADGPLHGIYMAGVSA